MIFLSRVNLASMRHWIRLADTFLVLFPLLPINTPLTFLAFDGEVALTL